MHIIRCLTLIECAYDFVVVSKHLPGKHNSIADALSRNHLSTFLSLYIPTGFSVPHSSAIITTPTCGMSEARLDLCKLGNSVCKYFHEGLASSTQQSYDSAKARFINFCSSAGSYPLPLSEHLLCFYVSFLADNGLAHSSIKCYLSAARHLQISHGFPDPNIGDMPRLKQTLREIKSFQAKQGRQPRSRLPITPAIFRSIRDANFYLTHPFRT